MLQGGDRCRKGADTGPAGRAGHPGGHGFYRGRAAAGPAGTKEAPASLRRILPKRRKEGDFL